MPSKRRAVHEQPDGEVSREGEDISRELLPTDRMPDEYIETEEPGDQRPPPMSPEAEKLTRPNRTPPGVGKH